MDSKGQINIIGAVVFAVAGIIGVVVFSAVYASINTSQVPASTVSILSIISLLLAAVIVIGILGLMAYRAM